MSTLFKVGGACTQKEIVAAVRSVFPKFPAKKLKDNKQRFVTAITAMGQLRFEHEINRQRGFAFDATETDGVWSVK